MRILIILAVIGLSLNLQAQTNTDETAVKATINQLFEGMKKSDSTLLKSAFAPDARMETIAKNKEGKTIVRADGVAAFVKAIAKPHTEIYDERLMSYDIKIDGDLATAWTPYQFYVGDKFSHCGVNTFTMVRLDNSWKIWYIIDTRRKEGCK